MADRDAQPDRDDVGLPTLAAPPTPPPGRQVVLHTRVVTETGGGPDKTILVSASFLEGTPYWAAAAYMHPPGDPGFETVRQRAADVACPLIGVPDKGPLDRSVYRTMIDLCQRMNVAIWHAHDYKSNLIGLAVRPFHAMKLVTTVHGWVKHTSRTPLYYAVDRLCLPYYHHVICVSEDLEQRVRDLRVPASRCTLVHNAIDHVTFSRQGPASEAAMRREVGTPAGRLVLGAVGRLSPEKGFGDLIHAAGDLVREGLDFEVWIAGDGDHRPQLEQRVAALGLTDRVRLLGFVKDTRGLYEALDGFVLSSLREGLPNVVLEALSMRAPLVSTRVAGVPAMIEDGREGLLVPIGQPAELAAAMRRVLVSPELRASLADAGRALIERRYTFAQRMAKIRSIYDAVLDRREAEDRSEAPGSRPVGRAGAAPALTGRREG